MPLDFSPLVDRWFPDFRAALAVDGAELLPDAELRRRLRSMLAATAILCFVRRRDPVEKTPAYEQLGELSRRFYRRPGDDAETLKLEPGDAARLSPPLGETVYARFHRPTRLLRLWRPEALGSLTVHAPDASACPLVGAMLAAARAPGGRTLTLDGAKLLTALPNTVAKRRESAATLGLFPRSATDVHGAWAFGSGFAARYEATIATEDWLPTLRALDAQRPWTARLTAHCGAVSARLLLLSDGVRTSLGPARSG